MIFIPRYILIISLACLAGCATQAGTFQRIPPMDQQASAYVGDPVYMVKQSAASMTDYYSGVVTQYGGEAYEVLYSGVSNGQLRMQYREFVQPSGSSRGTSTAGMLARPSFTQELTYDYDGTPTKIRVKSVVIDVMSADQDKIVYVVRSGFREEGRMEAAAKCKPLDNACRAAATRN